MLEEQNYCDWCFGAIDAVDRQQSAEVGTNDASTWACAGCLDSGRVFLPPEWWEGDVATWPIKDISDLVALVARDVEIVLGDIHRTTESQPEVVVDAYRSLVRIRYGSFSTTPSVSATSDPEALAQTADYLKERVVEEEWSPWPVCPSHDIGGVYPRVQDELVIWWCRHGDHKVAQVGHLGMAP